MPIWSFLFSNDTRHRWLRHLSFWITWLLFEVLLYSFTPSPLLIGQPFLTRLYITLPETLVFLLPQLFLAYSLMNVVITRMLIPEKYLKAIIATLILILITAGLAALLSITVIDWLRYEMIAPVSPVVARQPKAPTSISIGVAMLAGLRGAIMIGGIASAIKLMKCFYEKHQASLALEKDKMQAELHVLKAQLHPHFLFNTLNNIYSLSQHGSDKAPPMILRLSGMLRYVLYDGSKERVPLNGELNMIQDYIKLEALRYDESLDLSIDVPQTTNAVIAPLLLLPFVENAFKHGASRMLENPWISLRVELNQNSLSMVLVNGRDPLATIHEPGIGIANVKKRLAMLYPQKFTLQLSEEEELFFVKLTIEL